MFHMPSFFSLKSPSNMPAKTMVNKQPETNPFHVSSSALFDPKQNDQVSFLQNLEKLRAEVESKKTFLDEIKCNTESIGVSLKNLKLVADMGQSLCDVHKGNSKYVIQKTQIRTKLNPETSIYSEECLRLKQKIQDLSSGLEEFQKAIASCFGKFNQMSSEDNNSFQEIKNQWESKISEFESLVEKIETTHNEYSEFKNNLNLDEFENKLKEDSASSALAAYQMTKGRYFYSAKREFQNSESINVTFPFKNLDYRSYESHYKTLIDCIEKIQNDVNQGISSHTIIKSYSSRLSFMEEIDANRFLYKLIVASIHKNPISRYRNQKTKTILNMISDLQKLQSEKRRQEINYLTLKFSHYISTFNEKLYFGVVDTNNQKLMPVSARLGLFISEIRHIHASTSETSKEYFINKIKSFHVIKSETLLVELVDNIFIMSQYSEVIEKLISQLNFYQSHAFKTSILTLDTLAAEKTGHRGTFVGELTGGDVFYYEVRVDSWGDSPWSGRRNDTDRDGYYYETVEGRRPYYVAKGIFYDEQGREVHRINC